MRANRKCSGCVRYDVSTATGHSKQLCNVSERLYEQIDHVGNGLSGYKPGTAWYYHCSKHRESELKYSNIYQDM